MNRMSYTYSTYIYAYDADTKIRVLINPDGTKLAVATDITRALGYQSNSQAGGFIRDLHLEAEIRQVVFDTRKRGVAKAYCLRRDAVKQLLDAKCNNPDFCGWLLDTVMIDNKGCDDENEPIRPYKNVEPVETEHQEIAAAQQQTIAQPTMAQIDKIIAELLMNGAIGIGDRVYVESKIVTGMFMVSSITIEGDNLEGNWQCTAQITEVA